MGKLDAAWSAGDLAKAVCDELVSKGLLNEKPLGDQLIREDREKNLTQVFAAAKLDGASMATMNGHGVEVAVRSTTQSSLTRRPLTCTSLLRVPAPNDQLLRASMPEREKRRQAWDARSEGRCGVPWRAR